MEPQIHAGLSCPRSPAAEPFTVQCCGGQGEENQWSPDQDTSRVCHPLGAPENCHSLWHSFCKWFQTSNRYCTAEMLLKPGALQHPALNPECDFMAVNQGQHVNLSVSKRSRPTNHTLTTECNDLLGVSLFFSYFPFPACFLVVFSSICDYSIFNLPVSFHKISSM